MQKWRLVYNWLLENKDVLTLEEKNEWMKHLTLQNEKTLQLWSEQLELLDELKEKLLENSSFQFETKLKKHKGVSLFELGIYDKAIEVLKKDLGNTEKPSRIYLYLGFSYLYLDQGEKARESFLNSLHQTKDTLEKHFAYIGLGLLEGRAYRLEEAIRYFEKGEELLFNPDVVYNLGICYLLLNIPQAAISYFKKVIESGEDVAEAVYFLGKCYMDSGEREKAMEVWYNAIHELNNKQLLTTLAVEFEEKGLFSCALYCYERLENLGVAGSIVLHGRAWNYGLMDEKEKAKKVFKQLFAEHPRDMNAWISYLWLLQKWDDEEFLRAKEKVKQLGMTHPLLDMLV